VKHTAVAIFWQLLWRFFRLLHPIHICKSLKLEKL
jgi:hypothetical protein